MNKIIDWFTPQRRRYLYRIANAGVLMAVGYGVLSGDESDLWMLTINAILGLADANVPSESHEDAI